MYDGESSNDVKASEICLQGGVCIGHMSCGVYNIHLPESFVGTEYIHVYEDGFPGIRRILQNNVSGYVKAREGAWLKDAD